MRFQAPVFLSIAAILIPALAVFLIVTWRAKERAITRFIRSRLLAQLTTGISRPRQVAKRALQLSGISLVFLALARPGWGFSEEEARLQGLDIIIALDTSKSMLAADVAPNRLERAKLAAQDLLRLARQDRFGLVAFAGNAFLQCPLTLDDEAFRTTLLQLDTDIIPEGGTALAEAIDTAVAAFNKEGGSHHVLVLFTDGEDHEAGVAEAALRAAKAGIRIFTVGVGTPAGEILHTSDPFGNKVFIKDVEGNAVKSRLNENLLREIAQTGDGFYLPLQNVQSMTTLYERGLVPLPRKEGSSRTLRQLTERFQWPLGLALLLLILESLLRDERRSPRTASHPWTHSNPAPAAVMLALLAVLLPHHKSLASAASAHRAYSQGRYADALGEYRRLLAEDPANARLHFNAGTAAFRLGAARDAATHFTESARDQDLGLQQKSLYNLGNSLATLGASESDDSKKLEFYEPALKHFDSALQLRPDDEAARANRDILDRRIQEIRRRLPQQPNPKQDRKDSTEDSKDQPNQDPQDPSQKNDSKKTDDSTKNPAGNPDQPQEPKDPDEPRKNGDSKDESHPDGKSGRESPANQGRHEDDKTKDSKEPPAPSSKPSNADENPREGRGSSPTPSPGDAQQEERELKEAAAAARMTPAMAEKILDAQKGNERSLLFKLLDEKKSSRSRGRNQW